MLKRSLAVVLALMPVAAFSAPELYGNFAMTLNRIDRQSNREARMTNEYSYIGVRGGEELEGGVTLAYKLEFGIDPTVRGANNSGDTLQENAVVRNRDQWLGLSHQKAGTLRVGTISTSYKTSAAAIDPMFQTFFEARGFIGVQSRLQSDDGAFLGRSSKTLRYDSPERDGRKFTANYALVEGRGDILGLGMSYEVEGFKGFVDFINSAADHGGVFKLAGQADFGNGFRVSGQLERGADVLLDPSQNPRANSLGVHYAFMFNGSYTVDENMFSLTAGRLEGYSNGYALTADHKLGAKTSVYGGMAWRQYQKAVGIGNDRALAIGLRYIF